MIKEAVENLIGVKVKAVNTTITKGKSKRFRGQLGKRKNVKKAYVTFVEGNTIDVSTSLVTVRRAEARPTEIEKPRSGNRPGFLCLKGCGGLKPTLPVR